MALLSVGANKLDTFHFQYLQPDEAFLRKVRQHIDQICEFLKARCFQGAPWGSPKVLKIVKGGSLGKGTSLKRDSDADLVLFLDIFKNYTDQESLRKIIIEEVERRLRECRDELDLDFKFLETKWSNPRVLSFQLRSKDSENYIDFDVLPAFDALGQYNGSRPDHEVYTSLIETGMHGEFSPCVTELQRDFIICRPSKLKSLIRLVKYWYKELPEKKSLPPKYALELLAVYAWENGSGQDKFDMAEGFRTVLWLIERHEELCIFWTKCYDFENETIKQCLYKQLWKPRPVILDPADPTGNVGEGKDWDLLAKQATFYASQKCCLNPDGSCVQPWNVPFQVIAVLFIDANKLDKFHADFLQPDEAFLQKVRSAIDQICEFLKARCFQGAPRGSPKVLKIVKGGSLGKGTSLKGGSDADLVLFLNTFKSYTDQEESRKTIIEEVKRQLIQCQEGLNLDFRFLEPNRLNPQALSFQMRSRDSVDYIDFDVLPAYDALGQYNGSRPDPEVYTSLIETRTYGQFSTCFTELQKDFIVDRPTKLKSLIRLVKHWYKKLPEKKSLPPKYALELLAVYAWENGSGQTSFDMAEGFRTVLWLVERHEELCIFWTKYYDFENKTIKQCLHDQLRKPRPVILDPADPTGNVGEGENWDLLAKHATFYANQRCCVKPDGSRVQPWNVPVICPVCLEVNQKSAKNAQALLLNVKLLTGEVHSLASSASKTVWDFKIQVGQEIGVPPCQQKLARQDSTHTDLRDSALLSEYKLQSGDTLLLMVKNEESIPLFLKNPNGRTSTYYVLPSDPVSRFRARVREQERVQENQFWLVYQGQPLEDGRKLSDYNIAPEGTVFMNLRVRGGWA